MSAHNQAQTPQAYFRVAVNVIPPHVIINVLLYPIVT